MVLNCNQMHIPIMSQCPKVRSLEMRTNNTAINKKNWDVIGLTIGHGGGEEEKKVISGICRRVLTIDSWLHKANKDCHFEIISHCIYQEATVTLTYK